MAKTGPKPIPWQERIWRFISPEPNSGCWLWEGALNGVGYGKMGLGGGNDGTDLVHRLTWQLVNGAIPAGLFVLHRCDVRSCCNPEHLFLGTPLDNMTDMHTKGRFVARSRWPACGKGHPHTEANTTPSGRCRECWNAYMRRFHAARRHAS